MGEGCTLTMESTETSKQDHLDYSEHSQLDVKLHGIWPKYHKSTMKRTSKRSYKRALNRALTQGVVWYHGKLMTARDLGATRPSIKTSQDDLQNAPTPQRTNKRRGTEKRTSIFSWNSGGLSSARFQCLIEWLSTTTFDICCIQETHWCFTNEWTSEGFLFIHSGTTKPEAGVLTIINAKFCNANQVSWYEAYPGRLLQVRLKGDHNSLDVVNGYQHVFSSNRLNLRTEFWNTLQSLLHSIPSRNFLCLVGGYNTSLPITDQRVGTSHYQDASNKTKGPEHKDWKRWHNLLEQTDLIALNTWISPQGPTFISEKGTSRVDYICFRGCHCDQRSKQCLQLLDHPLLQTSGCRHIPLTTTIPTKWRPPQSAMRYPWNHQRKTQVYEHYVRQSANWTQTTEAVTDLVNPMDMNHYLLNYQDFHKQINDCILENIQLTHTITPSTDRTIFRQFMKHSKTLHQINGTDLKSLFQTWYHMSRRSTLRRSMNQVTKHTRRSRRALVLQQAKQAARAHNAREFFIAIRKLAPRNPKKPIHLRSAQGALLDVESAADYLQQWNEDLYSDVHSKKCEPLDSMHWPFDDHTIRNCLQQLPCHKALTPDCAPAPVWKALRHLMAVKLNELGTVCQNHNQVPHEWGAATTIYLNKPGKSSDNPAHLRPICLLEPLSKVLMNRLGYLMRLDTLTLIKQYPQFAYLPGRSINDAIRRVVSHCEQFRTTISMLQHKIHRKAAGVEQEVAGSFILSLDLSRAFDTVPRQGLYEALHRVGVPAHLINFLQHIYNRTECTFSYKGIKRVYKTEKGVRQGCSAAPTLWALYTADLFVELSKVLPSQWVKEMLTLYADDLCIHCHFWNFTELQFHLQCVSTVLEYLESYGLKINFDKTVMMFKCMGSLQPKVMKQYVQRTPKGTYFCIPRVNQSPVWIQMRSCHTYLGIQITYGNYHKKSLECRVAAAKKATCILHSWLFSTKGLSIKCRVQLWYQTVFSCLISGLLATGFTMTTLTQFDAFCILQLRRLLRQPVHLDHISNKDFLVRNNLKDPLIALQKQATKMSARETQRAQQTEADDILSDWTPQPLLNIIEMIEQCRVARRTPDSFPNISPTITCPHCQKTFSSTSVLRQHLTKIHGERTGQLRVFNPSDLYKGLPTCARCRESFTTWDRVRYHIEFCCLMPLMQVTGEEFLQLQSRFANYGDDPAALTAEPALCQHFCKHCSICNQYLGNQRSLQHHWRTCHPTEWSSMQSGYEDIVQQVTFTTPCQYCQVEPQSETSHVCKVLQNLTMVGLAHGAQDVSPDPRDIPQAPYPCSYCTVAFRTKHGRAMHIRRHHETVEPSFQFNMMRDLTDTATCTHCGAQFKQLNTLKKHIELQRCSNFDPHRQITLQGLPDRVEQAVKDLMLSTVLENDSMVEFFNTHCALCCRGFKRRNELARHLAHAHSEQWIQTQHTALELSSIYRGATMECYCIPKRSDTNMVKHKCTVFHQAALLLSHLGVNFDRGAAERDYRYWNTIRTSWENQFLDPGTEGAASTALIPDETSRYQVVSSNLPHQNIETYQCHTETSALTPLSYDVQDPLLTELTLYEQLGSSDEAISQRMNDWMDDFTAESLYQKAFHTYIDSTCATYDHWKLVLTSDLTSTTSLLPHISMLFRTLYPTLATKIVGGRWHELFDNQSIVSFLSDRCLLCSGAFTHTMDLQTHLNLVHGCLPIRYLKQIHIGMKVMQDILKQHELLPSTDQVVLQALQVIYLRAKCHLGFYNEPRRDFVPRDGGHLETRRGQGSAQTVAGQHTSKWREEKKRQSSQEGPAKSRRTTNVEADANAYNTGDPTRRCIEGHASRNGISDLPQSRTRKYSPKSHADVIRMAEKHREGGTTSLPSSSQHGSDPEGKIPEDSRSFSRERAQNPGPEESPGGREGLVPLPGMEQGSEKIDPFQIQAIDGERDDGTPHEDPRLCISTGGHTEVSQSQEDAGRLQQSHSLHMDGITPVSRAMASFEAIGISQFLAVDPDQPQTSEIAEKCNGETTASITERALRIFKNSNGVSCYINCSMIGLTWLAMCLGTRAEDWLDAGLCFDECTTPTPIPMDVHHRMPSLMRRWFQLSEDDPQRPQQHDAVEFLNFLLQTLQPCFINFERWPKWSLMGNPDQHGVDSDRERGLRFSVVSLPLPPSNVAGFTAQQLIMDWHDMEGHCKVFTSNSRGMILHLERNQTMGKDQRPLQLGDMKLLLPMAEDYHSQVQWLQYHVKAVTYHIGVSVQHGHYRTMVHQRKDVWLDYDDSKVPLRRSAILESQLSNATLLWLQLEH